MEKKEYEMMYALEEDYWWFKAKRNMVESIAKKLLAGKQGKKQVNILDVGCGTGLMIKQLQRHGNVEGIDASDEAVKFCSKRGLPIKKGTLASLPYKDGSFDIVTVLDVLYHKNVKDDQQALLEIYRVLKKGGYIIVTDSAMKCLWSRHDLAQHAARRYSKTELKNKLFKAGFKVKKISYFNTMLFLPILVSRKIQNLLGTTPKSDIKELPKLLNKALYVVYTAELLLLRYTNYPAGVSILAVGEK